VLSGSKLKSQLGPYTVVSGGREWVFSCPICKRPKLYVNPRSGEGFCQRCRRSFKFKDSEFSPWDLPLAQRTERDVEGRKWVGLPKGSRPLFSPLLEPYTASDRIEQERAQRYFTGRGFSQEDAERYGIHFCSEGKYEGRIIFPVTYRGVVWTFIARDYWERGNRVPKVLHPPSTTKIGERLAHMGLDLCLASGSRDVVLVEGPFDVMAVGSPPGVALHGTTLQGPVLHLLLDSFDRFVVFLDPDRPGQIHARETFANLRAAGKAVAWIRGAEDDPAAMGKAACREVVDEALQQVRLVGTGSLAGTP
jgi:DNA primase